MKTRILKINLYLLLILSLFTCKKEKVAEIKRVNYPGSVAGINECYIALDQEKSTVESFDTTTGIAVIAFEEEKTYLESNSIIIVDVDTMGYIRKVTDVTEEGNKLTLITEPANMADLFIDKKFALSTEIMEPVNEVKSTSFKSTSEYLEAVSASFTDDKGYIHPIKVVIHTEDKSKSNVINMLDPSRKKSEIRKPIIDFYRGFDGMDIYKSSNIRFYISEGHVELSSDAVFEFDFRGIEEVDENDENLKVKKGDLYEFKYYLDSRAEALVRLALEASKSIERNGSKEILSDVVKVSFQFLVFGVPVWITIDCDIEAGYRFNADASLTATGGFRSTHELEIGVHYLKGSGVSMIKDYDPENEFYPLTVTGNADMLARLEIYPNIEVKFYGFFGPYCNIKPYIEGNYNGSFYTSGGSNYFSWNSGIDIGLDIEAGVKLEFAGLSLLDKKTDPFNCFNYTLWNSPDRLIQTTTVESSIIAGESTNVTFKVLSSNDSPVSNVPVYFSGDGSFDKTVTMTSNGLAIVNWSPGDNPGIKSMNAKIINGDGETIEQVNVSTIVLDDCPSSVTDIDGNVYNTVKIGDQCWMAENLAVTHFNNGEAIPIADDDAVWESIGLSDGFPAYCWYDNNYNEYGKIYGALYNGHTIFNDNLCPSGWHVPSNEEWTTLISYLNGESIAGGKLKELGTTHWYSPNTDATNESGFTALPGGNRGPYVSFQDIGKYGCWWSSWSRIEWSRFLLFMSYNNGHAGIYYDDLRMGLSVRCIKD